ncbi:MAG: PD40 domain-containing protein, partial [Acidobacteriota bacterium]
AQAFDLDRLEFTDKKIPVVEQVAFINDFGLGYFSVSEEGTFCFRPGSDAMTTRQFVWIDREGGRKVLENLEPGAYSSSSLSPDGSQIALELTSGDKVNIWIYSLFRNTFSQFTFHTDVDRGPAIWMPDSQRIIFTSNRDVTGEVKIYWTKKTCSN